MIEGNMQENARKHYGAFREDMKDGVGEKDRGKSILQKENELEVVMLRVTKVFGVF